MNFMDTQLAFCQTYTYEAEMSFARFNNNIGPLIIRFFQRTVRSSEINRTT